ncbi:MAG TPA: right-handed parallel beta-helix repeat-containing protein [Kiritimatiellia bacterium]|nr:right-handed parallel beta-helix repeat-containing protein [Kiritimatiellia bacterium]HRZ12086.1 right-handed parallel beta-helix repeat-containing protein [Kiritimatiellia bacterium]HSA18156.1 right-handed parallel beta-helix repeat-containing protein [Kiritimatiellia bacterium]
MLARRGHLRRILLLALFPAALRAATHYVSPSGLHQSPFTNWEGAATTIQAALSSVFFVTGNTVLVAAGTYTGPGNNNLDFGGRQITLQSVDGPSNTIIACTTGQRGLRLEGGSVNSHVIGFTIQGATVPGAVWISSRSDPVFEDCWILNNHTLPVESRHSVSSEYNDDGQLTLETTVDVDIYSGSGGGLVIQDAAPVFRRCVIGGNRAGESGGGALMVSNSAPLFEDCLFLQNEAFSSSSMVQRAYAYDEFGYPVQLVETHSEAGAGEGGGVALLNSTARFSHCIISDNYAAQAGGGIWAAGGLVILATNRVERNRTMTNPASHSVTQTIAYDPFGNPVYSQTDTGPGMYEGRGGGLALSNAAARLCGTGFFNNQAAESGGGIWLSYGSLTADTSRIEGNVSGTNSISTTFIQVIAYDEFGHVVYSSELLWASNVVAGGTGGGMAARESSIHLRGSSLSSNQAKRAGGGLYAESSVIELQDVRLEDNRGSLCGAGLYMASNSSARVSDSVFMQNQCSATSDRTNVTIIAYDEYGSVVYEGQEIATAEGRSFGGAIFLHAGNLLITNSLFSGNATPSRGGGLFALSATAHVDSCRFYANKAQSTRFEKTVKVFSGSLVRCTTNTTWWGAGGALGAESSVVAIVGCTIASNEAGDFAGGMCFQSGSTVTVENCALYDNLAGFAHWSTTRLNEASGQYETVEYAVITGRGAACYVEASALTLRHVTVNANNATARMDTVCAAANASLRAVNTIFGDHSLGIETDSVAILSFSRVPPGWPGDGNLTNDARVVQDWRLAADSPCIDAATNIPALAADIEGENRWDDPAHPNAGSFADMGADEFVDIDGDGMADAWEGSCVGSLLTLGDGRDYDRDDAGDRDEYEHGLNPAAASSDGDPMTDGWELERGTDPLADDGQADPDNDTLVNADEFVADTDPLDGLDYLHLSQLAGGGVSNNVILSWWSSARRTYRVFTSSNILDWVEADVQPGTGTLMTYEDDRPPTRRNLLRVSAEIPP